MLHKLNVFFSPIKASPTGFGLFEATLLLERFQTINIKDIKRYIGHWKNKFIV